MDIVIDPDFQSCIFPMRPEERLRLESNIKADGCSDPLILWKGHGILIDGHNRYDICKANGIPFKTEEIGLSDREAVLDWIDSRQLGRRNLTPDQYSLLRGRRYNRTKPKPGGTGANQHTQFRQNDGTAQTAEQLAKEHGVSPRTIERDGLFADAIEEVKAIDPEIEADVAKGNAPPKKAIVEAAKMLKQSKKSGELADAKAKAAKILGKKKTTNRRNSRKPRMAGPLPVVCHANHASRPRSPIGSTTTLRGSLATTQSFDIDVKVSEFLLPHVAIITEGLTELLGTVSAAWRGPLHEAICRLAQSLDPSIWVVCKKCNGEGIAGGSCSRCNGCGYQIPTI